MRIVLYAFLISLITFSCQPANNAESNIKALEKKLQETNAEEDAKALLDAYNAEIEAHADDVEMNGKYSYRMATTYYRMNRFSSAADELKNGISKYFGSTVTPQAAELLGSIYAEKLNQKESAYTIWQSMLVSFPSYENTSKLAEKLPENIESTDQRLDKMVNSMFDTETGKIDFKAATSFINNAELMAILQPKNAKSPDYLHKAAETARSVRMFEKALDFYRLIYNNFPSYDKAPQALFLQAFTLDNDLQKYSEAKVLYEEFLKKYPENDFADDTQFLLENLGKDEAEIIKSFEKNNQ